MVALSGRRSTSIVRGRRLFRNGVLVGAVHIFRLAGHFCGIVAVRMQIFVF